jgi:hypothetical protein
LCDGVRRWLYLLEVLLLNCSLYFCQPTTLTVAFCEVGHHTERNQYAGDRTHNTDYIAQG